MSEVKEDKVSFSDEVKEESKELSKEETMFRIDNDGNLIPEKVEVKIYDHTIDTELLEESEMLAQMVQKKNSVKKVYDESMTKLKKELADSEEKLKKERSKDEKNEIRLVDLQQEVNNKKNGIEAVRTKSECLINEIELKLSESRSLIKSLEEEKKNQIEIKIVEAIPLTSAEAYNVFHRKKSPLGEDTDDVTASVIAYCIKNPNYSLEDAKKMKLDYKLSFYDAVMELSQYQRKSYRQVMLERLRSDKKKDMPRT